MDFNKTLAGCCSHFSLHIIITLVNHRFEGCLCKEGENIKLITKLAIFIGGKITIFIALHFNDGCKEFIRGELVKRGTGKLLKGRDRLSFKLINCLEIKE